MKTLLEIEIPTKDVEKAVAELSKLRSTSDQLKAANKELAQSGQKNSEEYTRNAVEIKKVNAAARTQERTIIASQKAQESNAGSLAQMRAQLSTLTNEYVNLSKEERENEEVGGAMQQQIKGLSDELKENESAIGDNRRNVGNYSEAMQGAIPLTGGFSKAFAILNKVMKANPLVLVAGLIALIASKVANTQKIVDSFNRVLQPLNALFQHLIGILQPLAERVLGALSSALKDPIGALKDLGENILQNLVNRFKGFMEILGAAKGLLAGQLSFSEALSQAAEGTSKMATGIENLGGKVRDLGDGFAEAARKGAKIQELTESIEKANNKLIISEAKLRREYNEQREISQDRNLSEQERISAAERAIESQNKLAEERIAALDMEIERAEIQATLNDTDRETQGEINKLIAERENVEAQAAQRRMRVLANLQSIEREEENAKIKLIKARDERIKEGLKNEVRDFEAAQQENTTALKLSFARGEIAEKEYQDRLTEIESDALKKRGELLAEQLSDVENNTKLSGEARAKLMSELNEKIIENDAEAIDEMFENRISEQENYDKDVTDRHAQSVIEFKKMQKDEIIALKERFTEGLISQEEYEQELTDLEEVALTARREMLNEARLAVEEDETLSAERRKELSDEIKEKIRENEAAITEFRFQSAQKEMQADEARAQKELQLEQQLAAQKKSMQEATLNNVLGLLSKESVAYKAAASFQAMIDAFGAANKALNSPLPPPLPQIFAATALATGLANVAKINSTQPAKFAEGVIAMDGPGTGTSDSIPARISKGESVMTAKATGRYAPVLAEMEASVGNKPKFGASHFAKGKFASGIIGDARNVTRGITVGETRTQQAQDVSRNIERGMEGVEIITQISDLERAERREERRRKITRIR